LVASGLGFIPGLSPAWVLPAMSLGTAGRASHDDVGPPTPTSIGAAAASGVTAPARAEPPATVVRWFVLAIAVGAIPIVLATQFRGGAAPQWAGRYLLTSGLLLAIVGWARLATADHRRVAAATAALAVATTGTGVAWLAVRSHDVADTIAAIERRPEPVIVSGVYHLAREGGATYGDTRWLTLDPTRPPGDAGAPAAAHVLEKAHVPAFASVDEMSTPRRRFEGFHSTESSTIRLFDGVDLRVTHWEADA
jgi:hypothetical protein